MEGQQIKKKRGRKPKGGKVIFKNNVMNNKSIHIHKNVVVHLKCSSKDTQCNSFFSDLNYEPIIHEVTAYENEKHNSFSTIENETESFELIGKEQENKKQETIINEKIKKLQNQFHLNIISTKESSCFWCTCNFDNHTIYIPKHKINNIYEVYGCFCSPECAVAYLYDENIDTSTKWERYSLLNSIYSDIYNYTSKIMPAPEPRYLLSKFFGNLHIDEFRSLHCNKKSFLILNKPISRILPELFDTKPHINIHNRIFYNKENGVQGNHNSGEGGKFRLARNKDIQQKVTPYSKKYWTEMGI